MLNQPNFIVDVSKQLSGVEKIDLANMKNLTNISVCTVECDSKRVETTIRFVAGDSHKDVTCRMCSSCYSKLVGKSAKSMSVSFK